MNYRHQFHAGNFADVFKHVLLLDLLARMQAKERGILYLDTHAGRGTYSLAAAQKGDSLQREPEHPSGWGKVVAVGESADPAIARFIATVLAAQEGDAGVYPGSPMLVSMQARPQDRLFLCEKHPDDVAALRARLGGLEKVTVHERDGYGALRATLPPPEKRALVLIDPPFEDQNEFERVREAVGEGLSRMPAAVIAVWHPISERANPAAFAEWARTLKGTPNLNVRLMVGTDFTSSRLKGCGLHVFNPPWGVESGWQRTLASLRETLALGRSGESGLEWIVDET